MYRYEIRLQGHLDQHWSAWFEGLAITYDDDDNTVLRGPLVDEAALHDALVSRHLAGAGLDVFEKEPPDPANPLLLMDQVIVTPHVATGTLDSLKAKARFYSENICRVLAGEPPLGLLG